MTGMDDWYKGSDARLVKIGELVVSAFGGLAHILLPEEPYPPRPDRLLVKTKSGEIKRY